MRTKRLFSALMASAMTVTPFAGCGNSAGGQEADSKTARDKAAASSGSENGTQTFMDQLHAYRRSADVISAEDGSNSVG